MIVKDSKFITKARIFKKKYESSNFEFGFVVACSNNKKEVVEYLVSSEIYNKAVSIKELYINGLEYTAKNLKSDMVDYLINKINPLIKEEFKKLYKEKPEKYNEFINPLILKHTLDNKLEQKQNTRKMKI